MVNLSDNGKKDVIIEFAKVKKKFNEQVVCQDISFKVYKNNIISILGPSGCGKTVTLKMLIGLIVPDSGSIYFDNIDIAKLKSDEELSKVRRKISMVFQGAALFDSMSVFENIAYPLKTFTSYSANEIKNRVFHTLEMVGLPDVAHKMPHELSGGMKKRIGLARAIITEPEIILYDEPNAGLDPINTTRIVELIMLLKEKLKCTSIVITHDMQVAEKISDSMAFFYAGMVRKIGNMNEFKNSEDELVKGFVLGNPSILLTTFGGI